MQTASETGMAVETMVFFQNCDINKTSNARSTPTVQEQYQDLHTDMFYKRLISRSMYILRPQTGILVRPYIVSDVHDIDIASDTRLKQQVDYDNSDATIVVYSAACKSCRSVAFIHPVKYYGGDTSSTTVAISAGVEFSCSLWNDQQFIRRLTCLIDGFNDTAIKRNE
jgi:hypothetical protein